MNPFLAIHRALTWWFTARISAIVEGYLWLTAGMYLAFGPLHDALVYTQFVSVYAIVDTAFTRSVAAQARDDVEAEQG